MKSKTTILWLMLAVVLGLAIWILNAYFQPVPATPKPVLAGFRAREVNALDIVAGGREINVIYTNHTWQLQSPLVYPAQKAAIEGLLSALEKLVPTLTFTAAELNAYKDVDAEFGFDHPQFAVDVTAGDQVWHLRVGNKTANGDGVYVRLVGATGAFITDLAWLQYLPHAAGDWRDTTLVEVADNTDWLVITNGAQAIELRRDSTSRLWYLVRPLQARANNLLVASGLGQLRSATVVRFVSDDPKADLTAYGLEPAAMDVWLGHGTNLQAAVHTGMEVKDLPGEIYARREGWNAVLATAKNALADWRKATVNDFRDPNLVEITAPVTEIQLRGKYTYTLRFASNAWTVAGDKFPVDPDLVTNNLLKPLANIRVTDFVKDSATAADLQSYGFSNVVQYVTLKTGTGDTRTAIAELQVGGSTTNDILYVKRSDEGFVYATPDFGRNLPGTGDFFRTRRIWKFSETNVALVTTKQNGQVRQMIRNGANDWSLPTGTNVIIEPHGVEETVHQLGDLVAGYWLGRNLTGTGVTTNSLEVTVELKTGEKFTLALGKMLNLGQDQTTALGEVTLDGEHWDFILPPMVCALVAENLAIRSAVPANPPAAAP